MGPQQHYTRTVTDSLESRCGQYRREYQLPASVDQSSHRITLRIGAHYGAIGIPSDLGQRVRRQLLAEGINPPIVAHPRADRWTFLTGPAAPLATQLAADFFRRYITVASTGSQVALPSPADEATGYRSWVRATHADAPSTLPPQAAVLDAIRQAGAPVGGTARD